MMRYLFSVLLGLNCAWALAQAPESLSLPDPLTLEYVQAQAGAETHHQLIEAVSSVERAQSQIYQSNVISEWQANVKLQASVFDPSILAADQSVQEYRMDLYIEKLLYDFGRSDLLQDAAMLQHEAVQIYTGYVIEQRRLEITRRFLDVLLADLKYTRDDEAMAIAYVQYDNAQEKHALRQMSDVDLLAAENRYQTIRFQRMQSENLQRSSRAQLAEIINRPGELASNLSRPQFIVQRELPEYQLLVDQALNNNARLQLLRAGVETAQMRMQSAQYQSRPKLSAEFNVLESTVDRAAQDDWRASVILNIPLLEQQAVKAQVSTERSQWQLQRAMLLQEQGYVRQRILSLWQQIQLLNTRLQQMKTQADYNELYLDRSRALYELEVTTDLGDAMVALSETRYQQAQVEFDLALAWMELDMITRDTTKKGN